MQRKEVKSIEEKRGIVEDRSRIPSHLFGVPKWEDRKYGGESIFEEIMAENFQEFMKNMSLQTERP